MRGWTQTRLAKILNGYRAINPPYLANILGTKVRKAIRQGIKEHEETDPNWFERYRKLLSHVTVIDMFKRLEAEAEDLRCPKSPHGAEETHEPGTRRSL